MLTSHVKGVKNGYPLRILARQVEVKEIQFNSHFISRMLKKIDWRVLTEAAISIGHGDNLPMDLPLGYESSEGFLRSAHHVLMEIEVVQGELECPESGRKFPIQDGIPNMLLRSEEVS
jgi:multifunctional methyltransferase subunit TRM112